MLNNYSYDLLVDGDTCIHVESQEESDLLEAWAKKYGLKFPSQVYKDYEENTCHWLEEGTYSSKAYALQEGYKVLKLQDIVNHLGG